MRQSYELAKLRARVAELEARNAELELKPKGADWYDSGCTIDEPDDWEESARHWADESDWESSSC